MCESRILYSDKLSFTYKNNKNSNNKMFLYMQKYKGSFFI